MAQSTRHGHKVLGDLHRTNHDQPQRRVVHGDKALRFHRRSIGRKGAVYGGVCALGHKVAGKGGKVADQGHGVPPRPRGYKPRKKRWRQGAFAGAHRFNQHTNRTATGQTHGKGVFIGHTISQDARITARHHLGHHGRLDTPARDRSHHGTIAVNHHLAAHPARGGAPCLNHRRKPNAAPRLVPRQRDFGDLIGQWVKRHLGTFPAGHCKEKRRQNVLAA